VGHIARAFESAGIPTVIVAIQAFQARLTAMTVPRLLVTPHLMGRPIGQPGDTDRQQAVIRSALTLLETAEQAGTVQVFSPDELT
jgi:hypothetical protein